MRLTSRSLGLAWLAMVFLSYSFTADGHLLAAVLILVIPGAALWGMVRRTEATVQ
jgi:hypothetical protein